jgi:hypothetical protein
VTAADVSCHAVSYCQVRIGRDGELTMNVSEMVAAADYDAYPAAAEAMTEAADGRFAPVAVGKAARLVLAAWVAAVNGDEGALASIADDDAAHWLLNPVEKPWVIAPGPLVTEIRIWKVDPAAEPPEIGVDWRFTGRQRRIAPGSGPGRPARWEVAADEQTFVGNMTLALTGSGPWPWRLARGTVTTLDAYLG